MDKKSPQIISLPKFLDDRGNLSFLENESQLPFVIQRVHWIYDVPGGEERGGLAYKTTEEFVVAMSGSFDVIVDDGTTQQKFTLNRSYYGLYIPAGTWRAIENFSTNSVAVIAASTHYDSVDGIRDYDEFIAWTKGIYQPFRSSAFPPLRPSVSQPIAKYSVTDCSIIELDRHHSQRKGDISVVENDETVPFDVKRIYYLYDVTGGVERGGHAHKALYQLIIAVSGSFTVTLDDGMNKKAVNLNRPYQGMLVKPGLWRDLDNFSSGSVCLVLASEKYNAEDYIRNYKDFIEYRKQ